MLLWYSAFGVPKTYGAQTHAAADRIRHEYWAGYYTWDQLKSVYALTDKQIDHILNGWQRGWLDGVDQGQGI